MLARCRLTSIMNDQAAVTNDEITILVCWQGHSASKRFVLGKDGQIEKVDYNAGMFFGVMTRSVSDIFSLSTVLQAVETLPNAFVIRGALIKPPAPESGIRRLKENFATPPQGRRWALIDFDKINVPEGLDLAKDMKAVIEHLVTLLPTEFHDCSYHYQLSSSAGMGNPDNVSAHVWFWLSEAWPDDKLKAWAKAINAKVGYKLIDPALFNDVQAHYTAAPVFEGMANPFPVRSALVEKSRHAVSIREIQATEDPAPQVSGPIESGPGFEGWLARIGDHPGGEGFHEPIIRAAASYVSTHGRDDTDKEALFKTIRDRVIAADRSQHDDDYVEKQMASRDHIMDAINGALPKFGTKKPIAQRKSIATLGATPHFEGDGLSAAEASARLQDVLNEFFAPSTGA